MHKIQTGLTSLAAMAAALISATSSVAAVAPFTWDPAGASPPLSAAGSSFTADRMTATHYLYAVAPTSGPYPEMFLEKVQGFTLGGAPVATPGLNGTPGAAGSYGLYFNLLANFERIAGVNTFHSLDVTLMADPGNRDGGVSSTPAGLSFSNTGATGSADDVVLATGSLLAATLALDLATGTRNAHFVETFQAAVGEAGFFVTPLTADMLIEEFLTAPASSFATVPGSGGSTIQMVNGGTAVIDLQVPEPASIAVLATGLLGVLRLHRRRRAGVPVSLDKIGQ